MKKTLTLLSAFLLLMISSLMAQTITQTNTQFPNPGFECWNYHSSATVASGTDAKYVPYNWHTFDEAIPDITYLGQSSAVQNHHSRFTSGGINNSMYIGLIVESVLSVKANGALSTGRTYVGSTSATSASNYNFTHLSTNYSVSDNVLGTRTRTITASSSYSTSGNFSWSFVGCPDSMSFYYYTSMNKAAVKPLFKVFLHQNGEFKDRANGTLQGVSTDKLIGSSVDTFPNLLLGNVRFFLLLIQDLVKAELNILF